MATYTSIDAIKAAIIKEAQSACEEAVDNSYNKLNEELQGFYSQGAPSWYRRTGKLGGAGRRTGVSNTGSGAFGEVYIDQGYGYQYGNFDGDQVVPAAETNSFGILGRGGFWSRTEAMIPQFLHAALASRF